MRGSRGVVISLCDLTGNFVQPWVDAGFRAVLVDPQHGTNSNDGRVERIAEYLVDAIPRIGEIVRTERVALVAGWPVCTDVAVSGSRWFDAKRAKDPHFQAKAALLAEQCRTIGRLSGAPWFFENPVSVFSSIFGSPAATFNPWHYSGLEASDNYTKTTCLWHGGGFAMPARDVLPKVQEAIDIVVSAMGRMVPKRAALAHFGGGVRWLLNFIPTTAFTMRRRAKIARTSEALRRWASRARASTRTQRAVLRECSDAPR